MPRPPTKFPVLRKIFPRIIDYRATAMGCYLVDARPFGKRQYFTNLKEAKARADQIAVERENHGTAALTFSARDRELAVECRELLRPYGATLRDATQHFIKYAEAERLRSAVPTVRDATNEYLATRDRDHERGELAKRTIDGLRHALNKLAATLGALRVDELSAQRVRAYLDAFPVTAKSRQDYRLRLSGFFTFCVRQGWLTNNPCGEIKIKVPRQEVVILSVEACERLLRCAEKSEHASTLVPYVALGLFAALRPNEATGLDWASVDLAEGTLHVLPETSKTREGRWITLEPAAVEWLRRYAKPAGPIVSPNHRRHWRSLMKACGYGPMNKWPQDGLRHTGVSMLLSLKRNRAAVAEECGHSVQILRRHYRAPIKNRDCAAFWSLHPRARLTAECVSASLAAVS